MTDPVVDAVTSTITQTPVITNPNQEISQALVSSWSMTSASIILITGQLGITFLELAQTFKKNRDYVVLKNLIVLLAVLLTWFSVGYAIAFGTDPEALDV